MTIGVRLIRFLALATVLCTAGCIARGSETKPEFIASYLDRYPLDGAAVNRIDVAAFQPAAGDTARVMRLAQEYSRFGQGKLVIFVPQSGMASLSAGNWVKQTLLSQGIAPHRIQFDARVLPPGIVRLAYAGSAPLSRWNCSNREEDLQQREDETSWLNRETKNFGCAYQSNMYAQADNPKEFVVPRAEGSMDAIRAANAVRRLRASGGAATPAATGGQTAP